MINSEYYLITFSSTHNCISAEGFLKEKQVKVKLIPLPSAISSGCGFALKILPKDVLSVTPFLDVPQLKEAQFFKLKKEEGKLYVDKWIF